MEKQKARNFSEHEQRAIIARWRASGLSQAEFCRQEGVAEWSLSLWKCRQERRDGITVTAKAARNSSSQRLRQSREKHWRGVLLAFEQSGLSVTRFCRENGINQGTFKRWRSELVSQAPASNPAPKSNPFVPVQIRPQAQQQITDEWLDVVLPGGSLIRVTERTPPQLLMKVLKTLEGTC